MGKHARERIQQRYNIELDKQDELNILALVNRGKCFHSNTEVKDPLTEFFYVKYNHIPIKVLCAMTNNRRAINIITVYNLDVEEYNNLLENNA